MITSGTVEYTTPRPFDSPAAKVALTFAIAPDDDPETVTAEVGEMAQRRAVAMLTTKPAPVARPAIYVRDTPVSEIMGTAAPADIMGTAAPADIMGTAAPADIMGDTKAPELITDKRLMDEVLLRNGAMIKAAAGDDLARQAAPVAIHRLIAEYAPPPAGLSTIPAEKRGEFLQRLAAL